MCGRLSQIHLERMRILTDIAGHLDAVPRYNIPPSAKLVAIRHNKDGNPQWAILQWGLIPFWAKDRKFGYKTFNAKAETVTEKPSFRTAIKKRRCVIPADGFYEWKQIDNKKQPFYIRNKYDEPLIFAGLWEHWEKEDEVIESCTILTTTANKLMSSIHTRMPVILNKADVLHWLDADHHSVVEVQPLLIPYAGELNAYKVTQKMNSPRFENEECVQKLENSL